MRWRKNIYIGSINSEYKNLGSLRGLVIEWDEINVRKYDAVISTSEKTTKFMKLFPVSSELILIV